MDIQKLKDAMETIEIPDDMKERIRNRCLSETSCETEEPPMKKRKHFNRTFLIAAVLMLCLPVIGMAVSNTGMFKDVKNIFGTVRGTEYEAAEEIILSASAKNGILTIRTTLPADRMPFSELELLSMESYQITDSSGDIILDDPETIFAEIMEGQAVFTLSVHDLKNGDYTLQLDTFIGSKKADQPLPIHGNWNIPFSI